MDVDDLGPASFDTDSMDCTLDNSVDCHTRNNRQAFSNLNLLQCNPGIIATSQAVSSKGVGTVPTS